MAGALVDLQPLDVAIKAFDRILVRVTTVAKHEYGLRRSLHRGFSCEKLGYGRRLCCWQTLVLYPGCAIDEQSCRFDIGGHICQGSLDHLEIRYPLAELAPPFGEVNAGIQAGPSHTNRTRGHSQPPAIQGRHGDFKSFSWRTQERVFRHAALFEGNMDVL